MRRILFSVIAAGMLMSATVAFLGVGSLAGPAAEAVDGSGTWTVMVYMCADNNLEPAGLSDLEEMESIGSKNGVTVIVLMDTFEAIKGTHWYFVEEGSDHYDLESGHHDCDCEEILGDAGCPGEQDMGDGDTLTYFIVNAVRHSPTDHYMLVLWDHGGGWRGVCWDDSSLIPELGWFSRLTTPETAASIREAQKELKDACIDDDFKLTIIGYDACLNGMIEVAYENRYIADYMFASINLVPWDGMDYEGILAAMTQDPRPSIEDIGKAIVDSYIEYYGSYNSVNSQGLQYFGDVTLSFFKLGDAMDDLGKSVDALARGLIDGGYTGAGSLRSVIASADSQTPRIPTSGGESLPFIDLGLFAEKLGNSAKDLKGLTDPVVAGVDEVVLYERHLVTPGGGVLTTSGITVYFTWSTYYLNPAYQYETYEEACDSGNTLYWGMAFVVDTYWDEFVFLYSMTYDENLVTLD